MLAKPGKPLVVTLNEFADVMDAEHIYRRTLAEYGEVMAQIDQHGGEWVRIAASESDLERCDVTHDEPDENATFLNNA